MAYSAAIYQKLLPAAIAVSATLATDGTLENSRRGCSATLAPTSRGCSRDDSNAAQSTPSRWGVGGDGFGAEGFPQASSRIVPGCKIRKQ